VLYRFIIKFVVVLIIFPFGVEAKVVDNSCLLYLMPCPQSVTLDDGYYLFSQQVDIYIEGMSNERQQAVLARSQKQLKRLTNLDFTHFKVVKSKEQADIVMVVQSNMVSEKQSELAYKLPTLGDDESYQLTIDQTLISIQANSDFGAIHALTTLVQIISDADGNLNKVKFHTTLQALHLPQLQIIDKPRFKWRGLLIDSVRHFIPISDIKRQLNGMAAAKLNVFHWHLSDDQGWRIESKRYPELHQMASDNLYYTQQEIKVVVAYASLLGIRVVPEFDVPGHASAIAVAYPELMAEKKQYNMERQWGVFEPVLDVSDAKVYQFIDEVVGELASLFPDSYVHIGGDEVNPKQWFNNDNIKQLMNDKKLNTSYDLHHYFNVKAQAILTKYQRKMMGWDEIYHPDLPKDIVIQSWRGLESLNMFAKRDYQGVLSTGFYIDQPQYSAFHYRNDPITNIDFYKSIPKNSKPSNIVFNKSDHHRTWQLTIPRLKGSDVTGSFILATKMNNSKAQSLSGYLKLNNNSFKKVTILTPLAAIGDPQKNDKALIFSMDSWMGPLQFELDLTLPTTLPETGLSKLATSPINRVFIGNAFYALIAQEPSEVELPNITLAPRLSPAQSNNILGAEATLWSEMVTKDNIDLRTWPRLFVIAERLWSQQELSNVDNMYQRLFFMHGYSEDIIGLKHNKQMLTGFSNFLGNANTKNNIGALVRLAELVEPAHYYTRHHIKYQQNKYHQLAPLDSFVDFLPVESFALIELNNMIRAYQKGKISALSSIKLKLKVWQENEKQLNRFIYNDSKFSDLIVLINDVKEFNQVATNIVGLCMSESPFPENTITQLSKQLNQLQKQQNEIVIAAIPLFHQLMAICQNENQQMIDK
jgi:hexosaminidase